MNPLPRYANTKEKAKLHLEKLERQRTVLYAKFVEEKPEPWDDLYSLECSIAGIEAEMARLEEHL